MKVVLIHKHFRPNHLAQACALASVPELSVVAVELAAQEIEHAWRNPGLRPARFETLVPGYFERTSERLITRRLLTLLECERPDAVIIAGYNTAPLRAAARWARSHQCRTVLILSVISKDQRCWSPIEAFKSWFLRRYFDAAFVGGRRHQEYLLSLGFNTGQIWKGYEAVDNDMFAAAAEKVRRVLPATLKRLPTAYFLYVGRLHRYKNIHRLLKAYGRYRKRQPHGWGLVLVGDGPLCQALQQSAARLRLPDVVWEGAKEVTGLPAYYALAGAVILPSIAETWGLSVNEGMACGLPVLVSDRCGCVPDLVREGENGYQFNPENIEEIAAALDRMSHLSASHREALGNASRRQIALYDLSHWVQYLTEALGVTQPARNQNWHSANVTPSSFEVVDRSAQ